MIVGVTAFTPWYFLKDISHYFQKLRIADYTFRSLLSSNCVFDVVVTSHYNQPIPFSEINHSFHSLPPPRGAVKPVSRPARMPHICAICNKQFKNNYNLRRHQSVHTGVRMKDRAREQAEGPQEGAAGQAAPSVLAVGAGGRVERTTVPLSLLHLSAPPLLAPPVVLAGAQQPPLGSRDGDGVAMANVMASVNPHAPPPAAVVMATGATVQVG